MRSRKRGERRKNTFKKCLRRKNIIKNVWKSDFPRSIHRLRKFNLSCNCDMCRSKTRDKIANFSPHYNPPARDMRKQISMKEEIKEYWEEIA